MTPGIKRSTVEQMITGRDPGAYPFGQRATSDLLGEAAYRTFRGAVRPLWHDMPENERAAWRQVGIDAMRDYCWKVRQSREKAGRIR